MVPPADSFDDPRVTPRFYRPVTGGENDVVLLGVVHDHPASVARVEAVLDRIPSPTLALELPPVAVPLYRAYVREGEDPPRFGGETRSPRFGGETRSPRFGGEMSAAIAAAPGAPVYGIDAPNWSFCRRLCTRILADSVSPSIVRRLLSGLGGATREALTCRVAATLTHATSMTVAYGDPIEYTCRHADSPARQAEHERAHVSGVQTLLKGASDEPTALAYRDETRERCMIDRLRELRSRSPVVGVVGVDHLDRIETGLSS